MDNTLKTCNGCKKALPLSQYSVRRNRPSGTYGRCRRCRNTYIPNGKGRPKSIFRPAMVEFAISNARWNKLTAQEKDYAVMLAQDVVKTGVLTEAESRRIRPDAWAVIDGRQS